MIKISFLLFTILISDPTLIKEEPKKITLQDIKNNPNLDLIQQYWQEQDLPNRSPLENEIDIINQALKKPKILNWFLSKIDTKIKDEKDWQPLRQAVFKHTLKSYAVSKNYSNKHIEEMNLVLQKVCKEKSRAYLYNLARFITYPIAKIRRTVYSCLGDLKDDRSFILFSQLANSKIPIEKIYAIDAFSFIYDDRTVPFLIKSLKNKNPSVRYYAMRTLEKMQVKEAIPFYIQIAQQDLDEELRIFSIKIIQKILPLNGFYPLTKIIKDNNPNIRKVALMALKQYKKQTAGYYISEQLRKENKEELKILQLQALQELNTSGGMTGINHTILEGGNLAATWGLHLAGKLKDRRALEAAKKKIINLNKDVRIQATWALGQIGNSQVLDELFERINDTKEAYFVQAEALNAIEKINSDKAFNPLYALLHKHPDPRIRLQITELLRRLLKKRFSNEK